MRLFDWGKINFVWSPSKENADIMNISKEIIKLLDDTAKSVKNESIYSMELVYSVEPEMYINSILK